jgi:hypothetical protein
LTIVYCLCHGREDKGLLDMSSLFLVRRSNAFLHNGEGLEIAVQLDVRFFALDSLIFAGRDF